MKRVDFDLFAEQDATTTRLMLHVEGDPAIVLASYSRSLAENSGELRMIQLDNEGFVAAPLVIGILITLKPENKK